MNGVIQNIGQAAAVKNQALATNRIVLLNMAVQLLAPASRTKSPNELYHDVIQMADRLAYYIEHGKAYSASER